MERYRRRKYRVVEIKLLLNNVIVRKVIEFHDGKI